MSPKVITILAVMVFLMAIAAETTPTITEHELLSRLREEFLNGLVERDPEGIPDLSKEPMLRSRRSKRKSYPRNCYFSPIQCLFTRD